MTALRTLSVWLLLAVVMSANGVFRELALVPALGRTGADVASAALGIALILGVSMPFLRGRAGTGELSAAAVAATWVSLTIAFEFGMGRYVDRKSWGELLGNYAIWRGRLWPLVLATVGVAPFLWLRERSADR